MANVLLSYDPIGWGVPYGNVMVNDDEHEDMVTLSSQLLSLLLDFSCPDSSTPNIVANFFATVCFFKSMAMVIPL